MADIQVEVGQVEAETPLLHGVLLDEIQTSIVRQAMSQARVGSFRGLCFHMPPGRGKTRTAIVTGLNLYQLENGQKPMLIIASKTLIGNWIDELKKLFGTSLQYEVLHRDYLGGRFDHWTPHPHTRMVLTTPEVCLKSYKMSNVADRFVETQEGFVKNFIYHLPTHGPFVHQTHGNGGCIPGPQILHSTHWDGIFIDECQNYTNIRSHTSRAMASMCTHHRWLLSGTPLQEPKAERLLGFYLLLNYPKPNSLPELRAWLGSGTYGGINVFSISCPPPEIDAELHTEEHIYHMSQSEAILFTWFRQIVVNWFEYYKYMRSVLPPGAEELLKIRGHLLSLLTYIRIGIVAPKKAVEALVEKISREKFLTGLCEAVEDLKPHIQESSQHSTRLDLLYNILEVHNDESCIVFSNFVVTTEYARDYIMSKPHQYPRSYYILSSSLNAVQRNETLAQYRNDPNGVLFMTYNMGSEGLNLQNANLVINLEPAWNVGKEQQAVARAYRIGQTRDVSQHYLVSNTQFELSLLMKQVGKTKLLNEFLNGGESIDTKMKLGAISYIEMAELIEKEPIERLMQSGERHVPVAIGESVIDDLTPKKRVVDVEVQLSEHPDFTDFDYERAMIGDHEPTAIIVGDMSRAPI